MQAVPESQVYYSFWPCIQNFQGMYKWCRAFVYRSFFHLHVKQLFLLGGKLFKISLLSVVPTSYFSRIFCCFCIEILEIIFEHLNKSYWCFISQNDNYDLFIKLLVDIYFVSFTILSFVAFINIYVEVFNDYKDCQHQDSHVHCVLHVSDASATLLVIPGML